MAYSGILSQRKKNMTGAKIKQGSAVKLTAAYDEIELCTKDTDVFYGVAIREIKPEDEGDIGVIGTYKCLAGDGVTPGQRVGPGAEGKFYPVTKAGKTVAGVAEQEPDGDHFFEATLGIGITLALAPRLPAGKGKAKGR